MAALYMCPHCGERVDTDPDRGGGRSQEYIEDCPVCCRPSRIRAYFDEELDEYVVQVDAEI